MPFLHMTSMVEVNGVSISIITTTKDDECFETTVGPTPPNNDGIFDHTICTHSEVTEAFKYHMDCYYQLGRGYLPTPLGWVDEVYVMPPPSEDDPDDSPEQDNSW